jgi:AcrR family transcriptional regulator
MTKLTSTVSSTRDRILTAAFTLFGRYGFRRTSMEDIATEAGLSRAALYLQFRSKEDIFRELARGLHEQASAGSEIALTRDGPLVERLRAAVEAKTLRMTEIAYASPHGIELMDEKNRLCGDLAIESERRFQKALARALKRADEAGEIDLGVAGLSANEAADLFANSLHGLKGPEVTIERYQKRLASLVNVFVRGVGG